MISVQHYRGFALHDNQSYPLSIWVEGVRDVDPRKARELISSNRSLEEVKAEIKNAGNFSYRGILRFAEDAFQLRDVTIKTTGNITTINALLARIRFEGATEEPRFDGNISLIIDNDLRLGKGSMLLTRGSYSIILESVPEAGMRRGWRR